MKKTLALTSALALAVIATPASAQILGGGGGVLGGGGGALDTTIGGIDRTISSTTRGTLDTRGSTRGDARVDRRNGRVEADREADAAITGNASQLLTGPLGTQGASASGNGEASGGGSASAQLIGTDQVRGLVGQTRDTAGGAVGTARNTATGALGTARGRATGLANRAGSAMGSGSGSASGEGSGAGGFGGGLMGNTLAVAGSGASQGQGAFAVAPGMDVLAPNGERIGQVREVVANGRGEVQQLLVSNGRVERLVPAAEFATSGSALLMGMGATNGGRADGSTSEPASDAEQ